MYGESDEVFATKVRTYLKKINLSLTDADILNVHVSRYRYAQPVCGPGYLDRLPPADLPVNGLWVADTSHYYPEDRGISESIQFGRNLAREAMA
jgi:protoporphyrinogen oxidase